MENKESPVYARRRGVERRGVSPYVTVTQAANRSGRSEQTIFRAVERGKIDYIRTQPKSDGSHSIWLRWDSFVEWDAARGRGVKKHMARETATDQ